MAGKTNTEKIDDLTKSLYALIGRVDATETQITDWPSLSARVAVLEHQMVDVKKSLETLNARLWQIGIPLVVGVIVALLTALLRK